MNLAEVSSRAQAVIREVGLYVKQQANQPKVISNKDLHDFVTTIDVESEKRLLNGLAPIVATATFLAEESKKAAFGQGTQWIIDPIDGTTNFIHNVPAYAISVALYENGTPLLGIVYHIPLDKMYVATKNQGAYCNGQRIYVTNVSDPHNSLIATGFPYKHFDKLDQYMTCLQSIIVKTAGVRRIGSAAIDLAHVAEGTFEGFFEYGLQPWDVAAGILLVQEAGGKVSTFSNGNIPIEKQEIIATNGKLHKFLLTECKALVS